MPQAAIHRGPTSATVAANIKRIRKARGLTTAELSERLAEIGRPMLATGITSIETGRRRVDVDDLMALAIALGVNTNAVLLPATTKREERQAVTGRADVDPHRLWDWAEAKTPLDDPPEDDEGEAHVDFMTHAVPRGRRGFSLATPAGRTAWEAFKSGELASTDAWDEVPLVRYDPGSEIAEIIRAARHQSSSDQDGDDDGQR